MDIHVFTVFRKNSLTLIFRKIANTNKTKQKKQNKTKQKNPMWHQKSIIEFQLQHQALKSKENEC